MELTLRKVSRSFTRRGEDFFALKDIDLEVKQGEFLFLTGSSGSGKTTLLQIISGMLFASSGKVFLDGKQWEDRTDQEASGFRNRHIGFIPQEEGLLSSLTIFENISLPYTFSRELSLQEEKIVQMAERLHISHLLDEYPKELSGGEKRRAVIVRAMILEPEILLADEPTANLDEENAKDVMEALKDLNRQKTSVIVSTHDKEILFGSSVYKMNKGTLEKIKVYSNYSEPRPIHSQNRTTSRAFPLLRN